LVGFAPGEIAGAKRNFAGMGAPTRPCLIVLLVFSVLSALPLLAEGRFKGNKSSQRPAAVSQNTPSPMLPETHMANGKGQGDWGLTEPESTSLDARREQQLTCLTGCRRRTRR
jgi:hypothetical protein